ncbi:unnamed protein product, partial [Phaeothamnion confervicola]
SKRSAGDSKTGEETRNDVPHVEVLAATAGPNNCEVQEALDFDMEFELDAGVDDACWEIKFVVDSVNARHVVILGRTPTRRYPRGRSSVSFSTPGINVTGIKPCTLANAGLLTATLCVGDREVADVNLVVMVAKKAGAFVRCIYSPLG